VNPFLWPIDGEAVVRTLTLGDAEVVYRAVDENRDRLRPYMAWEKTTRSPDDVRGFIERSLASPTDEDALGIWMGEMFVGAVGLSVNEVMNTGEIGYWIRRTSEGRGLVTKACWLLVDHGFRERRLHRIEIHAAAINVRSRAVAERLGFTHEATLRQGYRTPEGMYADQVIYGLLENEWPAA
jgi:ribosomal-protein-serine acetyltransferase